MKTFAPGYYVKRLDAAKRATFYGPFAGETYAQKANYLAKGTAERDAAKNDGDMRCVFTVGVGLWTSEELAAVVASPREHGVEASTVTVKPAAKLPVHRSWKAIEDREFFLVRDYQYAYGVRVTAALAPSFRVQYLAWYGKTREGKSQEFPSRDGALAFAKDLAKDAHKATDISVFALDSAGRDDERIFSALAS